MLNALKQVFKCRVGAHQWGRWRVRDTQSTFLGLTITRRRKCRQCGEYQYIESTILND